MICRLDFDMFSGILIFEPNALISRLFGVFWSGFLHRTSVNDLQNGF